MKVLLPSVQNHAFPRDQALALSAFCEVITDVTAFWENRGQIDITQLNWPEELTHWREPTELELIFLRRVLQEWRKKSRVVVTRHNIHPHYMDTHIYRELYEIVYSAAHTVVHMGNYSAREFVRRYRGKEFLNAQLQHVIPHPTFSSYPDNITRENARRKLGIESGTFVFLVFGRVHSAKEKTMVMNAFTDLPLKNKLMIVPGWRKAARKEPVNRLTWARLRLSKRFRHENRYVPDDEVASLFRAADLVLIPRINVLNSGLIPLCIQFDCPMLIPECGNLTEIATLLGSEAFDPNSRKSLSGALSRAVRRRNSRSSYAEFREQFNPESIARQYFDLYKKMKVMEYD